MLIIHHKACQIQLIVMEELFQSLHEPLGVLVEGRLYALQSFLEVFPGVVELG